MTHMTPALNTQQICVVDIELFRLPGSYPQRHFDNSRPAYRVIVSGDRAGIIAPRREYNETTVFLITEGTQLQAKKWASELARKVAKRIRPHLSSHGVKLTLGPTMQKPHKIPGRVLRKRMRRAAKFFQVATP